MIQLAIIPPLVTGLVVVAWMRAKRPGVMTAERDKIYRAAVSGALKDPDKLRKLADGFEKARLYPQAQMLRQRAALRELPDEIKQARNMVFRKAMNSTNKVEMLKVADAFDGQGATAAARRIREAAEALPPVDASGKPVIVPVPEDAVNSVPPMTPPANETEITEAAAESVEAESIEPVTSEAVNVQQAAE